MQSLFNEHEAAQFVASFLEHYPKATLQDIYKGAFQDWFGPAHILTDRQAVERYILVEMKTMEAAAERVVPERGYEPCSWRANFFRVDLSVIANGKVPVNDFVDAFMESAAAMDTTQTAAWQEEWTAMQKAVRRVSPLMQGFATDSAAIAHLLSQGKYVMHHSRMFNEEYHPHYRIIRKDVFERNIRPLLVDPHSSRHH